MEIFVNRPSKAYYLIAFIEGASVMSTELSGGQMISIYFGNSLQVWALVIGLTITGLAAGYYAGGYYSGRIPEKKQGLFAVTGLAALMIAMMPGWGNVLMKMAMILGYSTGAFVSCLLFILPAMLCLGAISPMIIDNMASDENTSGRITGNIYALSTLGGIFACFISGFFLIPEFGLRISSYFTALCLGFAPILFFLLKRPALSVVICVILSIIIFTGLIKSKPKANTPVKILYKNDGLMGQIIVAEDNNRQLGIRRSILVNGVSQTYMHVPTFRSQWRYIHRIALYASYKPAGSRALVCGLGGGNLINELHRLGFRADAVDIDGRTEKIAKKFFGMTDSAGIIIDDARHFINNCTNKYDIIIFDLSIGEVQPSNIYTLECFIKVKQIMNPGGIIFLHYQNVLEGENDIAAKSIGKTLVKAGFHTKLINTDRVTADGKKQFWDKPAELIYFASVEPVDLNSFSFERHDAFLDPFHFPVKGNVFIEGYSFEGGSILDDDKPVMDILHSNTLESTRQLSLDELIPILIREKVQML